MRYERKIPMLGCADEHLREILLGRWKIKLIYYISTGVARPGQLQKKIPQASRRVLDMQLNQLVKHEIIRKTFFDEPVPRAEYVLTEFGHSLLPVLMCMIAWGKDNSRKLKKLINNRP